MSEDYSVLLTVRLRPHHLSESRTHHVVMGKPLERPALLKIAQLPSSPDFYLLYCDANGQELTDTLHGSIKAAMDQAAFEFDIAPSEWSAPSPLGL